MYINRALLKNNAKNTLSRGYWSCVLTGLVLALVTGGLGSSPSTGSYNFSNTGDTGSSYFRGEMHGYNPGDIFGGMFGSINLPTFMIGTLFTIVMITLVVSLLLAIFLMQPLEVGCRKFYMDARNDDYDLADMGTAFSENYTNVVKVMFLRSLYTFLWTLLFIIPGIVKSYEYRMIPYILAENPGISDSEAFSLSRQMMTGSKFDAFIFDLSFLGWFLLDSLTFGVLGIFYVNPYYFNACAELYAFLKAKPVYGRTYENSAYYGGAYDSGSSCQTGGYQSSGYQETGYGNPAGQQEMPGSGYDPGTGSEQPGGTVSAEDAKPFNTPYGQ